MASTTDLELPLLASAQAQKHVTVNEALARLDAAVQMRVVSSSETTPPPAPGEGQAWLVPAGATDAWAGQAGRVAVAVNGGWAFLAPRAGWRLWDAGAAVWRAHDGAGWVAGAIALSAGGAATVARVVEIDHTLDAGATSTVAGAIPAFSVVTGVTARVTEAIAGTPAWRIGVAGAADRYATGLGTAAGSFALGLSSPAVTYYGATDLVLGAEGGGFTGGAVRLAIHLTELRAPAAV